MIVYFCPLFSGSNGNALLVQYGRTRLLIDAGRSGKQICDALALRGVDPATLSAVLITHEHSDHISAAGILARRFRLPLYATEKTLRAMQPKIGDVPREQLVAFDKSQDFYIGDIGVAPFPIPHDAADPVGYRIYGGTISVSVATDLGRFTTAVQDRIAGSELVLLESNHDPDLLRRNPHYSASLKQRILGAHGHLSNEDSSDAMVSLVRSGVKQIILGHLSGENNTPELAMSAALEKARREGIEPGKDVCLDIARRDSVSAVYTIRPIGPGHQGGPKDPENPVYSEEDP